MPNSNSTSSTRRNSSTSTSTSTSNVGAGGGAGEVQGGVHGTPGDLPGDPHRDPHGDPLDDPLGDPHGAHSLGALPQQRGLPESDVAWEIARNYPLQRLDGSQTTSASLEEVRLKGSLCAEGVWEEDGGLGRKQREEGEGESAGGGDGSDLQSSVMNQAMDRTLLDEVAARPRRNIHHKLYDMPIAVVKRIMRTSSPALKIKRDAALIQMEIIERFLHSIAISGLKAARENGLSSVTKSSIWDALAQEPMYSFLINVKYTAWLQDGTHIRLLPLNSDVEPLQTSLQCDLK